MFKDFIDEMSWKFAAQNIEKLSETILDSIKTQPTIYHIVTILRSLAPLPVCIANSPVMDSYKNKILSNNIVAYLKDYKAGGANKTPYFIKKNFNCTKPKLLEKHCVSSPFNFITAKDHYQFFYNQLSSALISKKQHSNCLNFFNHIPQVFAREKILYEFRLHDCEQVDIFFGVPYFSSNLDDLVDRSAWTILQNIITASNQINQKGKQVQMDWLEFDINGNDSDIDPSFFVAFHPNLILNDKNKFFNLLESFLGISGLGAETLKKCLNELPIKDPLCYIGHMVARGINQYKVLFFNLPSNTDMISYLQRLNYEGDLSQLHHFLTKIQGLPYHVVPSIDFINDKIVKIGFEIIQQSHVRHDHSDVLKIMLELGICLPEKMEAILDGDFIYWNSAFEFYLSHLSHLKICLEPAGLIAKAYLYYFTSSTFLRMEKA